MRKVYPIPPERFLGFSAFVWFFHTASVTSTILTATMATTTEPTTFPSPPSDLKILILGAGGREHALAFKLAQSTRVSNIYVCPGNGGTALMGGKVENLVIPYGGKHGYQEVVRWGQGNGVDLVVPGPEQPLVDGVERLFKAGEYRLMLPFHAPFYYMGLLRC